MARLRPYFAQHIVTLLRRHRPEILAVAIYLAVALIVLRGNIGVDSSGYPQGTNALNYYTLLLYRRRFPLSDWLYPYTDWGQPLPGYPGIDLVTALSIVNPFGVTALIRLVELASFAGSGLAAFFVLRRAGCAYWASLSSGFFYSLMSETSQFFEGHVQAMVSIALAPLLFYLTYVFFRRPAPLPGVALAVTSFLLLTSGDLGVTYIFGFFAVPMAFILIVSRNLQRLYTRKEILAIGWTGGILAVAILPWATGYLSGLNPQYTTSITSATVGFPSAAGQQLWLSLVGFVADNSFSYFFLHSEFYAWNFSLTAPLYLLVPCLVGTYVILSNRRLLLLFYSSGLLAVLISTGPTYSSLVGLNRTLYDTVPFFNYNPSLFRWVEYYLLVEALLLGFALTAAERHLRAWSHSRAAGARTGVGSVRFLGAVGRLPTVDLSVGSRRGRLIPVLAAVAVVAMVAGAAGLAALENWESFSEPPGIFEFPSNYTVGFQYVSNSTATGGVLAIPFGNIYERTPWGGVSSSSALVAGINSGLDTDIFEAGTPYSLAIDQFLGNGMTYGLTNNISKTLSELNVQYVVSTDYPNWSYPSDPTYDPFTSYVGFNQQSGLGSPVFHGGYQSVYAVPDPAGNISIFSSYIVYFGGDAVLYELLNQPWFNGSMALVNGSQVSAGQLEMLTSHATALVASPEGLASIPTETLELAEASSVPVVVMLGAADTSPGTATTTRNAWNVSNGVEFSTPSVTSNIPFDADLSVLSAAGYSTLVPTVRAECPPSAFITLSLNGHEATNTTANAADVLPFPYWNSSIVTAGINNQGEYPYNGTVTLVEENGTKALNWSFAGHNATYQYVNFALHSLAGMSGLQFNATTVPSGPLSFLMQVILDGTYVNIKSYVSNIDEETGQTTYSFYFPTATGPGVDDLRTDPGNISRFTIGLADTGSFNRLALSNYTSFVSPTEGFNEIQFASLPLTTGGGPLTLQAISGCQFDTVAAEVSVTQAPISGTPPEVGQQEEPSETSLAITPDSSGWGILQVAQTFGSPWTLTGAGSSAGHFPVDLGLNGWLVAFHEGETIRATYGAAGFIEPSYILQGVLLPVTAVIGWVLFYRKSRKVSSVP